MSALFTRLVRVLKIVAVGGIAIGVIRKVRGAAPPPVTGQAKWLPLADTPATEPRTGPVQFRSTPEPTRSWVAPVDGACPASHPIKGNADSGIFHVPGGLSYERTTPERCYATEADAEADGFRRAKR